MLAKLAGAGKLVVLEANALRIEKARDFGADACFDIKESTREQRKERITKIMGPKGVWLVIECSGVLDAIPACAERKVSFGGNLGRKGRGRV
jgi:threonine dehydrogenase-like Zn-dependent dehydrogenase